MLASDASLKFAQQHAAINKYSMKQVGVDSIKKSVTSVEQWNWSVILISYRLNRKWDTYENRFVIFKKTKIQISVLMTEQDSFDTLELQRLN